MYISENRSCISCEVCPSFIAVANNSLLVSPRFGGINKHNSDIKTYPRMLNIIIFEGLLKHCVYVFVRLYIMMDYG